MKTNEAPKSKFVYPDKLYARCKDNKTLDMSYAPQNTMKEPKEIFIGKDELTNPFLLLGKRGCKDDVKYVRADLAISIEDIQKILDIDDFFIKEKLVDTGRLPNNSKAYCKRILTEFKKWKNQQF